MTKKKTGSLEMLAQVMAQMATKEPLQPKPPPPQVSTPTIYGGP